MASREQDNKFSFIAVFVPSVFYMVFLVIHFVNIVLIPIVIVLFLIAEILVVPIAGICMAHRDMTNEPTPANQ